MTRRDDFRNQEYRATYAADFLDSMIATQLKVLREERGFSQARLAELTGMKQSRISTMENVSYSRWGIGTLKRLAKAFDLPLFVFFGTFGQLLEHVEKFSRAYLSRASFADDPVFNYVEVGASIDADCDPAIITGARIKQQASSEIDPAGGASFPLEKDALAA